MKCTAPHILFKVFDFKTPHIDQDWIDFMMSMPNNLRRGEYLFKKILYQHASEIFSLPTKSNFGLGLFPAKNQLIQKKTMNTIFHYANKLFRLPSPNSKKDVNYINFRDALRNRKDLKNIVYESIQDLVDRKLLDDIPINSFWENHQKCKNDFTNELIILSSIELHLKAGKKFKPI